MAESHRLFWESVNLDIAFISDPIIKQIRGQLGPYDYAPLFYDPSDLFLTLQKDIMNGTLISRDWQQWVSSDGEIQMYKGFYEAETN